eukprot:8483153-Heterocapsa_arctica.AAC.1
MTSEAQPQTTWLLKDTNDDGYAVHTTGVCVSFIFDDCWAQHIGIHVCLAIGGAGAWILLG